MRPGKPSYATFLTSSAFTTAPPFILMALFLPSLQQWVRVRMNQAGLPKPDKVTRVAWI